MDEPADLQDEMAIQSLLVFSMNGLLLAVDALAVREIRWLMEITPLEEAPPYVRGVVNLRGSMLPVLDLSVRFGHGRQTYHLTDSVIVADAGPTPIGLIVNEVHDVIAISSKHIEPSPLAHLDHAIPPQFVTKVAKMGGDIIMVLDQASLLKHADRPQGPATSAEFTAEPLAERYFSPEATPEERAIFRQRALIAVQAESDESPAGSVPLAVVGLNDEYFGVGLDLVREFAEIGGVTPVPSCPTHILGNVNLRGHILTIVDVRSLLDMPSGKITGGDKVIVTRLGDLTAGVLVDEVFDIVYLNPLNILPTPSATRKSSEKYLSGTAPYGGKMMSILNFENILTSEALLVAEEV